VACCVCPSWPAARDACGASTRTLEPWQSSMGCVCPSGSLCRALTACASACLSAAGVRGGGLAPAVCAVQQPGSERRPTSRLASRAGERGGIEQPMHAEVEPSVTDANRIQFVLWACKRGDWVPTCSHQRQRCSPASRKPMGSSWSYLPCRTGHWVPIWQPLLAFLWRARAGCHGDGRGSFCGRGRLIHLGRGIIHRATHHDDFCSVNCFSGIDLLALLPYRRTRARMLQGIEVLLRNAVQVQNALGIADATRERRLPPFKSERPFKQWDC
jgi:hypothetical protein